MGASKSTLQLVKEGINIKFHSLTLKFTPRLIHLLNDNQTHVSKYLNSLAKQNLISRCHHPNHISEPFVLEQKEGNKRVCFDLSLLGNLLRTRCSGWRASRRPKCLCAMAYTCAGLTSRTRTTRFRYVPPLRDIWPSETKGNTGHGRYYP
jgi:hypothetical protein